MNILGTSALYHDSAAALVVDGNIIAAAQESNIIVVYRFRQLSIV